MNKNVCLMFLFILVIIGCSSVSQEDIEPPCARIYESPNNYKGKSFTVKNDEDNDYISRYRYNKAMLVSNNRFVPEEITENKKATVICHEMVTGPREINQYVVALKVEGISETIYTNSRNVAGALGREESSAKRQDIFTAFKYLVGNKVWSKPKYSVLVDQVDGSSNSIMIRNLEELIVHDVIVHEVKGVGSNINSYVQVFLKRKTNDIVYVKYSIKYGVSGFNLAWHLSDPRELYKSWSSDIWRQIEQGQVSLGMTSSMVTLALGTPSDINATESRYGTRSQWVYKSDTGSLNFYYFNNGVLEAIQD